MNRAFTNRIARLAATALIAVAMASAGCGRPPQIGSDEQVFGEVDAFYTAVTSKRTDLLDQSFDRLEALHAEGKLPDAAYQRLAGICEQARRDEWRPAAETLWHFMRGQRKST